MSDEEKYTEREFSEKFEELRWNLLNEIGRAHV